MGKLTDAQRKELLEKLDPDDREALGKIIGAPPASSLEDVIKKLTEHDSRFDALEKGKGKKKTDAPGFFDSILIDLGLKNE